MDFSCYNKEIQELAEKVLDSHRRNDPMVLRYSTMLVKASQKQADPRLLGFAYYYFAEASFFFNHYENFRKNLLKGIKFQQLSGATDLLTGSYNMLAIDAMNKGYTDLGLDFFLKALSLCDLRHDEYRAGVIHMNLAQVYIRLKMESTAMQHLRQSIRLMKRHPDRAFYYNNLVSAYCTEGDCYVRMNKPEQAHKCMDLVLEYMSSDSLLKSDNLVIVPFHCFQIRLYHYEKRYQERDESLLALVESLEQAEGIADVFDDVYALGSFMLEIGRTELALRLMQRIEAGVGTSGIINLKFRLAAFQVQYYQQVNDREGLARSTLEYYELSKAMESGRIQSYQYSVEIQTTMEEMRRKQIAILEENVELTRQVETDSLTGLPNRYALNRFSDAAFERAFKNGSTLAVCILDVDHFKEYNDTYGHLAGDHCLHLIANQLTAMHTDKIFCARYGGDEFVVIYEGMTDDEVLAYAEQLRAGILGLKIPHCKSSVAPYVTVSQGIRNSVPVNENRLWDYLFAADNALYHMKNTQKGGLLLIHKTKVAESMFSN